jgi:hypothetical protein
MTNFVISCDKITLARQLASRVKTATPKWHKKSGYSVKALLENADKKHIPGVYKFTVIPTEYDPY